MRVKLDYDGKPLPMDELRFRLRLAGYTIRRWTTRRSPGGKGWHREVWLDPEPDTPAIIVALQAVLGSDPRREACNIQRIRSLPNMDPFWQEEDRWNVLYEANIQRARSSRER